MVTRPMLSSFAVLAVIYLEGCTTFSARYSIPTRASTLEEASQQVNDSISSLQSGVMERNLINGFTGIGALVGAAGAALSPVFKGSRDLTVGLAAFAAGNYSVNTVYANRTVTNILGSGIDALGCVRTASGGAVDSHVKIKQLLTLVDQAKNAVDQRIQTPGSTPYTPAQKVNAEDAEARADTAKQLANSRFASETELAGQISNAVQTILIAVNDQVQASLPDVAAIMRAGSAIGTSALAPVSGADKLGTPQPTPQPATPKEAAVQPPPPEDLVLNDRIDALNHANTDLGTALSAPVPTISTDSCKIAQLPATAPMSSDAPASVSIKFGDSPLSYKVSGGSGSYTPHWSGSEPTDVMAAMQGDTLRIFVKPGLQQKDFPGNETYQLDVYDSTPGTPKHLPTAITVKTTATPTNANK